jgi:hypothetical protein
VPELIQEVARGQDLLHILGDFNLSTVERMTVSELAEMIWRKIRVTLPGGCAWRLSSR